MIGAIVAVGADGVIGVDGALPWHYSADLRRFKAVTMGAALVMGRKTWDSIGRRPLPGRRNLVVSRSPLTDCEHFTDIAAALESAGDPCWVIGGGQIYALALPWCHRIDMTVVPDRIDDPGAVRFPELDRDQWRVVEEHHNEDDPRLVHRVLERVGPARALP